MLKKFLLAAYVLLLGSAAVHAITTKQEFVTTASEAGDFVIASSLLAEHNADVAAVKSYAKQMINDHRAAEAKLEAAAEKAGVRFMKNDTSKFTGEMAKLEKSKAAAFDTIYVELQRKAHEEAVALFKSYAESGDDPVLKQFAQETLPALQSHLDHVNRMKVPRM